MFETIGRVYCTQGCKDYEPHWVAIAEEVRNRILAGVTNLRVFISFDREKGKHWTYICSDVVRERLSDLGVKYRGGAFCESVVGPCEVTFYWTHGNPDASDPMNIVDQFPKQFGGESDSPRQDDAKRLLTAYVTTRNAAAW